MEEQWTAEPELHILLLIHESETSRLVWETVLVCDVSLIIPPHFQSQRSRIHNGLHGLHLGHLWCLTFLDSVPKAVPISVCKLWKTHYSVKIALSWKKIQKYVCPRINFWHFLGTSDSEWVLFQWLDSDSKTHAHMRESKIRHLEPILPQKR